MKIEKSNLYSRYKQDADAWRCCRTQNFISSTNFKN